MTLLQRSLFFILLSNLKYLHSLSQNPELQALMAIKVSIDPMGLILTSWNNVTDPCENSFEGVACNNGRVTNISLQGKGLSGVLPSAIADLKSLTGLYLHFNSLSGEIPREISNLTHLTDLYLNVNNLTGIIPSDISKMSNLQVLQLSYNNLTGSIPTGMRLMMNLSVVSLQHNKLSGAIPASLGDLGVLTRLDLSFNSLFGPIPSKMADVLSLQVLHVQNNTLSGSVPPGLKRLDDGFLYEGNSGLCGVGFSGLRLCNAGESDLTEPKPIGINYSRSGISNSPKNNSKARLAVIFGTVCVAIAITVLVVYSFVFFRRQKQKIKVNGGSVGTEKIMCRRSSPLISMEYPKGWDPVGKGRNGSSSSFDVLESFMFSVEDVEIATGYFSQSNFLGKTSFSTSYKGVMKDGSSVVVKCIAKTSCKLDESEFLKGLEMLTSLKHENLVGFKGFCCSKGRGECFIIYDYVPNGNLLQYLDVESKGTNFLPWQVRVSIIQSIAQGMAYLHDSNGNKPPFVHQNISAENVQIDQNYKALLSDSGLQKLLANDIIFSTLKFSAAMGYLAPEYVTTGRFTEKSDVYAFGMVILQILSGRCAVNANNRLGAEMGRVEDFIDSNLGIEFSKIEAIKLGILAVHCTHELPEQRPVIRDMVHQLLGFAVSS